MGKLCPHDSSNNDVRIRLACVDKYRFDTTSPLHNDACELGADQRSPDSAKAPVLSGGVSQSSEKQAHICSKDQGLRASPFILRDTGRTNLHTSAQQGGEPNITNQGKHQQESLEYILAPLLDRGVFAAGVSICSQQAH